MTFEESDIIDIECIDVEDSSTAPLEPLIKSENNQILAKNSTTALSSKNFKFISIKGKRIYFPEKNLNLNKHPETISELFFFHKHLTQFLEALEKNPDNLALRQEDHSLISKLLQDSQVQDVWRWESNDISFFPINIQNLIISRRSRRECVSFYTHNSTLPFADSDEIIEIREDQSAIQGKVQTRLFGFFEKSASELLLNSANLLSDSNPLNTCDQNKNRPSLTNDNFKDRIRPFYIKPNTTVARLNNHSCIDDLDAIMVKLDLVVKDNNTFTQFANGKQLDRKIIYFSESLRPCYYGTWTRKFKYVNARKPLSLEPNPDLINYQVDSSEDSTDSDENDSTSLKANKNNILDDSVGDSEDSDDFDFDVNNPKLINTSEAFKEDHSNGNSDFDTDFDSDSEQKMDLEEEIELDINLVSCDTNKDSEFIMPQRKIKAIHKSLKKSTADAINIISPGIKPNQATKNNNTKNSLHKKLVPTLNPIIIGPFFSIMENQDPNQILKKFPISLLSNYTSNSDGDRKILSESLGLFTKQNNNFNKYILSSTEAQEQRFSSKQKIDKKPADTANKKFILTKRDVSKMIKMFPLASKLQIQAVIQDNAVKEKRNSCKRSRWYVNERWLRIPPKKKKLNILQTSNDEVQIVFLEDRKSGCTNGDNGIDGGNIQLINDSLQNKSSDISTLDNSIQKIPVQKQEIDLTQKPKSSAGPLLAFFKKA
ncbi:hypothetical protein BB561_000735 [Smittium simulii]|uniref:Chromatin assembly factor 1 subunit A dimerization domain-containing protein n=1 Tax=Smittium simulii TaxID=133385 RepID=A0A2T9YXY1_9FUNG|nr:hypothetical protein BB561_000735 [Smittium simulii]